MIQFNDCIYCFWSNAMCFRSPVFWKAKRLNKMSTILGESCRSQYAIAVVVISMHYALCIIQHIVYQFDSIYSISKRVSFLSSSDRTYSIKWNQIISLWHCLFGLFWIVSRCSGDYKKRLKSSLFRCYAIQVSTNIYLFFNRRVYLFIKCPSKFGTIQK